MSASTVTAAPHRSAGSLIATDIVVYLLIAALMGLAWALGTTGWFEAGDDLGYWLGVAGGSMMLLLLLYPVRKHFRFAHSWGTMKWWFVVHMFLGVMGPFLILVHTTFRIGSFNAGVALFRMIIVALSGVIGRFHYPRQKIAMTAPVELDLVGKVRFTEVQKEKLIEFWLDIQRKTGLKVSYRERMETIEKENGRFVVVTNKGRYTARTVLLAMGRRGTPRKLEVPGEETAKVAYRLIDAAQYQGRSVLVVGGGDSALEAAIAISQEQGTEVILSYRSEAFARVKQKNRLTLDQQQKAGRIKVLLKSNVQRIEEHHVTLEVDGVPQRVRNDYVIVCAGGLLPTPVLQKIGIQFDTKFGST